MALYVKTYTSPTLFGIIESTSFPFFVIVGPINCLFSLSTEKIFPSLSQASTRIADE